MILAVVRRLLRVPVSPSRGVALALVVAAGLAACARPAGRMTSLLDEASQSRLDAVATRTLLVSLKGTSPIQNLPPLGEGGRLLGRAGTSVLLEVPRETLSSFAGIDGVTRAVVWGDANAAGRMDPGLRTRLLEAVDAPARAAEPIPMIATFQEGAGDLETRLSGLGATPRTVAGQVVTLDANAETAFRILALPDLMNLTRPRELHPLGGGGGN